MCLLDEIRFRFTPHEGGDTCHESQDAKFTDPKCVQVVFSILVPAMRASGLLCGEDHSSGQSYEASQELRFAAPGVSGDRSSLYLGLPDLLLLAKYYMHLVLENT